MISEQGTEPDGKKPPVSLIVGTTPRNKNMKKPIRNMWIATWVFTVIVMVLIAIAAYLRAKPGQ